MWEEALRVVVGAWTEDVFHFEGKHFRSRRARSSRSRSSVRTRRSGRRAERATGTSASGARGSACSPRRIGGAPESLAPRFARYRRGLAEAEPIGHFVNPRAATFTLAHVAETTREAIADARASFEWYVREGGEASARARALARRARRRVAHQRHAAELRRARSARA